MSGEGGGKILEKPGYHLRPQYDLHGLRRRRTDDSKGHVAGELPLTSMIDMFSILVIYLLMNFSATGEIFFVNKNLQLPKAATTSPLKTGPLISLVGTDFVLDIPKDYAEMPSVTDADMRLPRIVAALAELKQRHPADPAADQNRINIQAGEDTPIGEIKRALAAAMEGGWTNLNFVVEKKK